MKTYFFKAYNKNRKKISLTLDFNSLGEFHKYLYKNRLTLIKYRIVKRRLRVSKKKIIIFTENLKVLLESGLTISQGLNILENQEDSQIRNIIRNIRLKILEGNSLYSAFSIYKSIFGESYLNILLAGEESGKIIENLNRIYEKLLFEEKIKRKIKEAIFYPTIVFIFTCLLITFILIFIFPNFIDFFKDIGLELPLITKILIFISHNFFKILIFISIVSFFISYFFRRSSSEKIENLKLKIPIYGTLLKKRYMIEFCKNFSIMSDAGIEIINILEILKKGSKYIYQKNELAKVQLKLKIGSSIFEAFSPNLFFSSTQIQIIEIGEKSGYLEKAFNSIAFTMEKELEYYLFKLTSSLEPILLLILGIIVSVIILGLYLPILNISQII